MGWLDKARRALNKTTDKVDRVMDDDDYLRRGLQRGVNAGREELKRGKPYYKAFLKQAAPKPKPKPKKKGYYEKTVVKYKYKFR